MTTVVSIKFKNRGKSYFFDPANIEIQNGDKVIVETSNGLELADCVREPHAVPDEAVVPPLRPVVRVATADDLRTAENNRAREKEAMRICKQKIADHGLDMKLIDAECNFEGNKTTFYFTSDGRVDFRELVKDLAGIFRNRIELRQIGVRDEAKMLGGLGLCGRPYCCHQFMDDFKPVSTKMAKVQNLSLNPTKISGSCGRLMCCLRYEQEAYEDLTKHVPRQGAFVETIDGYGTAVQVNLLRQNVKVRLDGDDDSLHLYKAREVAQVPGGRPKDGEEPPKVLIYIPENEAEEEIEAHTDDWEVQLVDEPEVGSESKREQKPKTLREDRQQRNRNNHTGREEKKNQNSDSNKKPQARSQKENEEKEPAELRESTAGEYKPVKVEVHRSNSSHRRRKPHPEGARPAKPQEESQKAEAKKTDNQKAQGNGQHHNRNHHRRGGKPGAKPADRPKQE